MKQLHKRADKLTQKDRKIADELFKHNPGTNGDKMAVKAIQHKIAILARNYAELYVDLGKK